jgi:hypothetical protein
MERFVDPVVADLQVEYAQAIRESRPWKARWTLLVSYLAFAKVILLCSVFGTRQAWRNWSVDDQRAFNRTMLWIAIATIVSSVVVGLPSLQHVPDMLSFNANARIERLILYLVPSMLTFGVPAGLAIGAALGLSQRARSRRLLAAIGIVAVLSSSASLVNVAWVTPIANQSYRAEAIGDLLVRKGQSELTLTELRNSPSGTFLYHVRLAIAVAPLTLAIFGVVVATRRWRRAAAIGIACAGVVGFLFALNVAWSFNHHKVMPPRVPAWMPHILLAWATILIARLVTSSRPNVTRIRA